VYIGVGRYSDSRFESERIMKKTWEKVGDLLYLLLDEYPLIFMVFGLGVGATLGVVVIKFIKM
jgi:hypothetical protein